MSTSKIVKVSSGKVLDYTVEKTGYQKVYGSKIIQEDTTINVGLLPNTDPAAVFAFGDRIGNVATCVGINNGMYFFVLDAQYRSQNTAWSTVEESVGVYFENWSSAYNSTYTATELNDLIFNNFNPDKYSAFNAARNAITLQFGGLTLKGLVPNAYELYQIWYNRVALDALDPTVNANAAKSLTRWYGGDGGSIAWTCQQRAEAITWNIWSGGSDSYDLKRYLVGVYPVLEIPIN